MKRDVLERVNDTEGLIGSGSHPFGARETRCGLLELSTKDGEFFFFFVPLFFLFLKVY